MEPYRRFQPALDHLPPCERFPSLGNSTLALWMEGCQILEAERGEVVLRADQHNQAAYLVLTGALNVQLSSDNAAPLALALPGDLVGEVSCLCGQATSAWVIATEPTELVVIERDTLLRWANESHAFALDLLQLLGQRLSHSNSHARDMGAQRQALEHQALRDALTNLPNRHWLEANLPRLMAHPRQNQTVGMAVIMVDVDHFKAINDRWGHGVGDQVLQTVAEVLALHTRPDDGVVRLGGEEFLVMAPALESEQAICQLGERLRQAVASLAIPVPESLTPLQITVSVGVARCRHLQQWDAALKQADDALYSAKTQGRNRVVVAH